MGEQKETIKIFLGVREEKPRKITLRKERKIQAKKNNIIKYGAAKQNN